MEDRMDIDPPTHPGYDADQHHAAMALDGPGPLQLNERDIYGDVAEEDVESEVSDADSDELELRANTKRFDAIQEAFVAQHRAEVTGIAPAPATTPAKAARPHRRRLGPRKAAKPTPDIQFRLSLARRAFEDKDYEGTIQMLSEVIRINSETYQAWTLLSTVHEELGDREKATMCLMTAAHLVPKNVPSWLNAAAYALHGVEDMDDGPEKQQALERAITCYSQALTADKRNVEARVGKADCLMMQGHAALALAQYTKALEFRPLNIRTVRNMADVALDMKDPRRPADGAKRAYRRIIDHLQASGTLKAEEGLFEWSDLRIYLEFFGILEQWGEAARELKEISRWLLGRREEGFWEAWVGDDREWDENDDRRIQVAEFEPTRFPLDSYGGGLPVDLRAKLYVYRHKLGMEDEANMHLRLLDPTKENAVEDFMDFPDCLKDIGNALLEGGKPDQAMPYFNLFKEIAGVTGDVEVDADVLVSQGRCFLALGDRAAAEESFITAIEMDQDHVEARVQLANMYEEMYEKEQQQEGREEAFLLVREAMNLEARQGENGTTGKPRKRRGPYGPRKPREKKDRPPRPPGEKKSKYIPRRLINAEKRKQHDLKMTEEASKNYQVMMELKDKVVAGSDEQTMATWMKAASSLVDDFRSYKEFYPWEKYIKYLGYGGNVQGQASLPARQMRLAAMAERLQQNLAPAEGQEAPVKLPITVPQAHRGIPFDKWLDIFLDYAFCLVKAGQHREAYVVCHAARDSTIWTAMDTTYLIHLAWASCAVYAGDEETCVAIARYFMRDYMPGTDSYRMFSAMCRVCQTPVSWYTSGPAQKFILRQIKMMDNIVMRQQAGLLGPTGEGSSQGENQISTSKKADGIGLDVALLTIYGSILFSTTSYVYSLSYLARAASIDPTNRLINMSAGLAYIHYALKRQATNRQYLLTQGFAFLFQYYHDRLSGSTETIITEEDGEKKQVKVARKATRAERQEAHFNIARAYSLIGLGNLANEYYMRVLKEAEEGEVDGEVTAMGREDLSIEAAYNIRTMCFLLGDFEGAKAVADRWLVL